MHDHHAVSSMLSRYNVVIAGAGPVGLFLACELRLEDFSVLALEQAKDGTRDGVTYFGGRVWGVSLRYDLGSNHPLVGHSARDFEAAPRWLGEAKDLV